MTVLAPRIVRGFTLVADDTHNLANILEEMKLPVMEENKETFQPGGADGEVEIAGLGTKALTIGLKTKGHAVPLLSMFGGAAGKRHNFTGKKLVTDEMSGEEFEHAIDVVGRLTKIDSGAQQGGKANSYDHEIGSIFTYSEMWNGRVLHRFNLMTGGWDVLNGEPVNTQRRRFLYA